MNKKFVHIHNHSSYSTRDGLSKIEEMVEIAKENNELFAITDHGSIASWMSYYNCAKENGIKPVFGLEAYINKNRDSLMEALEQAKDASKEDLKLINIEKNKYKASNHIILIAKNLAGYYNILKLNNLGFCNGFYNKPQISYTELFENSEGIIATSACLAGAINQAILNKDLKKAEAEIELFKKHFGDDFYLEIQVNEMPEQLIVNEAIIKLAKKTNTKMLIGVDSHYTKKEDFDVHQDLLMIQNGSQAKDIGKTDIRIKYENKKGEIKFKTLKAPNFEFMKGVVLDDLKINEIIKGNLILEINEVQRVWQFEAKSLYFKNQKQLYKELKNSTLKIDIDQLFQNHLELDDKIEAFKIDTNNKLPHIKNADELMVEFCKEGMRNLKKQNKFLRDPKIYAQRLKMELEVIRESGFSTYFLILKDILDYCYRRDIALGAGRGSSVGSLVSYLLRITRVDPLDPRWGEDGLPFERFLSSSRHKPKYIFQNSDKEEVSFYEGDKVKVLRDNVTKTIKVEKIQPGDELLL